MHQKSENEKQMKNEDLYNYKSLSKSKEHF